MAATLFASAEDVEAQFYEALREANLDKIMSVWTEDEEILCVSPEGVRSVGVSAVRAAFETLFNAGRTAVQAEQIHRIQGASCEVHSVMERLEVPGAERSAPVQRLATLVFFQTALGWRMVAYHANHAAGESFAGVFDGPSVLH
jgi:ketosteroid isomerase-like protein